MSCHIWCQTLFNSYFECECIYLLHSNLCIHHRPGSNASFFQFKYFSVLDWSCLESQPKRIRRRGLHFFTRQPQSSVDRHFNLKQICRISPRSAITSIAIATKKRRAGSVKVGRIIVFHWVLHYMYWHLTDAFIRRDVRSLDSVHINHLQLIY